MDQSEIIEALRREAAHRHHAEKVARGHAATIRELVRTAHAAGIGPTEIAEAANLSRQAIYEVLRRQPS